jgi:hypothetical protein
VSARYIFNTSGGYVGFIDRDNLFDPQGEWLGFQKNGNEIYGTNGDFIGYVLEDDRIARLDSEPRKPRLPRPFRPLRPLKPLPPLQRLPMVPLLPPWRDVFEHVSAAQARQRIFPSFGGFFQPPSTEFNRFLDAQIFAADGRFLGVISRDKFAPASILNEYGEYGSPHKANSIFNSFGNYGSPHSVLSPFNEYAPSPPQIVKGSQSLGSLSVNRYVSGAVNPHALLNWLRG